MKNKFLLKIIIFSFLITQIISSCKTQKQTCNSYFVYKIPYEDSIVQNQLHEHYYFDSTQHCIFLKKEIKYYKDTITVIILN